MANNQIFEKMQEDGPTATEPAVKDKILQYIDAELNALLENQGQGPSSQFHEALVGACVCNLIDFTLQALIARSKQYLHDIALPLFWQSASQWEADNRESSKLLAALSQLAAAVEALCMKCTFAAEFVEKNGRDTVALASKEVILEIFRSELAVTVMESIGQGREEEFGLFILDFYKFCIPHLLEQHDDNEDVSTSSSSFSRESAAAAIRGATEALQSMDLWQLAEHAVDRAVKEVLKSEMEAVIENESSEFVLEDLIEASKACLPVLEYINTLRSGSSKIEGVKEQQQSTKEKEEMAHQQRAEKLETYIYKIVADQRIATFFDLVIDYPESETSLEELKKCLRRIGKVGYRKLVAVFGAAIITRLLHPGAATADIIHHYVSTIRALTRVDQSGTVLDLVSAPLRAYLRTRKDAIRCIVTMITEDDGEGEGQGFLAELEAEGEYYDPDADFFGLDADQKALEEIEGQLWEPPPFAVPGGSRRRRSVAPGDVVSMLVNIYGSKELFVSEYKSMLADRLLAKIDFDCDRELRTLELLKVRFGEQALHAAEVMLRDLADSKRINANVRALANSATPLKRHPDLVTFDSLGVTIVSELFWPHFPKEEFTAPREIEAMMRTFGHKYHALKTPRVLKWKPNLGTVSLTLTTSETDIEYNVSPLHAAILLKFESEADWSPAELAKDLGVSGDMLRRKIVYWINQGVILEIRGGDGSNRGLVYRRNEEATRGRGDGDGGGMDVDDGMDEGGGGGAASGVDAMAFYEPFVLGMLTNFDSLPLDRIHNMLKMYVTDPPYDRSIEQLSAFMGKLSTEDKVMLEGGMYKRRA